MARTTAIEVETAMGTSLNADAIEVFISTASKIVDENLLDAGFDADTLAEIEKWLACHFISSTRERLATQESVGDASITYSSPAPPRNQDLSSTPYGMMALSLDSSGRLARLFMKKASITAVPGPGYTG